MRLCVLLCVCVWGGVSGCVRASVGVIVCALASVCVVVCVSEGGSVLEVLSVCGSMSVIVCASVHTDRSQWSRGEYWNSFHLASQTI